MAVGMLLPGVWLLALALPGWFLTSRILPRWGLAAQLLAGACIGLGVNSFLLFLGLLFTGFLSVGLILGTTALWWALAWVVAARFTAKLPVVRQAVRFDLWQAVILGMGMLAAYLAIGKSYFASDSIVIWANKGYAIAAHGLAQGVSVWGLGSWKYTLNIPISIAAFQTLFGDLHPFSKIMYPVFYLALLLGMYEFLRRVVQPAAAGLAVIAFGTSPFIFFHSQVGYANLAFTAYYVLGTLLALQVFNGAVQAEYQKPQLALAGLLFALGAWSRAEGLPIGLALIALLALYGYLRWGKGWLGKAVWLALPLMGLALVWLPASNMIYTLPRNNTGAFSTAIQQTLQGNINLEEMGYAARSFAASLADWGLWGLAGLGALGLSWLPLRDKDKQDYSGVVLWTGGGLVLLVAFGTIYATTYGGGCDVSCWVNSGLNRYIMPGVALLWVEGIRKVFRVGE
jgi:hypothetical protein